MSATNTDRVCDGQYLLTLPATTRKDFVIAPSRFGIGKVFYSKHSVSTCATWINPMCVCHSLSNWRSTYAKRKQIEVHQ